MWQFLLDCLRAEIMLDQGQARNCERLLHALVVLSTAKAIGRPIKESLNVE
jgi:hypothetical protein